MFLIIRQNLIFLQSILICLLPLTLITGPFLPDLFFSISGLIFIILIFIERKIINLIKNKYFILIFLWSLYFIFSSFISKYTLFSLESSLFYFRFGLGALSIVYLIENNNKFIYYFIFFTTLTLFIVIVDGYLQYLTGKNFFLFEKGYRLSGFFGEDKKLGSYILRLTPLLIYLLIFKIKFKELNIYFKVFIITFFVMAELLIFLTYERNAILLSLIFIILFTTILIKLYNLKKILFFIIPSFIIFLLIFSNNNFLRFNEIKFDIFSKNKIIIHEQYTAHFHTALKIFIDNPIFGTGPKTFRIECKNEKYRTVWGSNFSDSKATDYVEYNGCSTHPHSTYLQLLSETGIIGALPLICIFLLMNYMLLRYLFGFESKLKFESMALFILLYINIFPFSPSGSFFGNWLSIIIYFPIGFLIHSFNQKI